MLNGPTTGLIYAYARVEDDIPAANEIGSWTKSAAVVPLPAPLLLLLGGAAGLGALRARRKPA